MPDAKDHDGVVSLGVADHVVARDQLPDPGKLLHGLAEAGLIPE
jgi:hypothetical protein